MLKAAIKLNISRLINLILPYLPYSWELSRKLTDTIYLLNDLTLYIIFALIVPFERYTIVFYIIRIL